MVFLATKAALAASIIGITIGAVSFFAAQAGNQQHNNGAPTQNRGVGTSSSSASTDSPLQLLFSGTASAGSGGFRLFETPPDCNCTVLTDCPHIGRRGFGIFRRTRTCGFHGFRRQICCDPKYITEQDLRLHLPQQPLFSARRRRPQRPPQQSPPRFLSSQQHPHIHADVNCKHASVQQCDCAIVQPQPDGSKKVENVASSFRSNHEADPPPPPREGDAKSTSKSPTTTTTSTSTTMSTTASVTPVDVIDTTEAVGLLDANLVEDPPSLRDLFADDENETESMIMTEKNVDDSSNNESNKSSTSSEERVGPFIYNGTFPSLSEFFSSNENVASGDIDRDGDLSYSLERDEEIESVTAETTTEEVPAATLELEDIGTGSRGSPRPLSLELDYDTVDITGRRVPPLPSVSSSPPSSMEKVIVDMDMDDNMAQAEVEHTSIGPEVTTTKFIPVDDDILQSHTVSPEVETTTVTMTPEAETTTTLVISTTTETIVPLVAKAATTMPTPTTTELPVTTDTRAPEAEVTTLTSGDETLPTTTTDSSLSYRNDRKDDESNEDTVFDPEIINDLEALDEEPNLTTTPAIPTTTQKSEVSLDVDEDVDADVMTTTTASTTSSTMLPEGGPNSGEAATSKPLILDEQHIFSITTDGTVTKDEDEEASMSTTPTTLEESTIAQAHISDKEAATSTPISSITTDGTVTNNESGDGGEAGEISVSTTPTTLEESTIAPLSDGEAGTSTPISSISTERTVANESGDEGEEASMSTTPTTPEESTITQVHISDKDEDVVSDDTDRSSLPTMTMSMSTSMLGLKDEAEIETETTTAITLMKEEDTEISTLAAALTTTTTPVPETNDSEDMTTTKMTPLSDKDGDVEITTTTTEGSSTAPAPTESSESFATTSTAEMPEIVTTTMSIAAYDQEGQVQGERLSTTLATQADAQEGTTTVPASEDVFGDLTSATVPATAETFTTTEALIRSTTMTPSLSNEVSNEPEAPMNDGDSDDMDFLTTTNLPTTTSTEASVDSNFSVKAILRNGAESLKLDFNLNEDVDVTTEKGNEETTTSDKLHSSTTEQESDAISEVTTVSTSMTPTPVDSESETTTARIHQDEDDPTVDRSSLLPTPTTTLPIMLNDLPEATTMTTTDSVDPDVELDHTENPTTSPPPPTTTLATSTAPGESENFEDEVVGTTTNLSILNTESSTLETTTSAARDEPVVVIEIEQTSGTTTESVPESTTEMGTTPYGRRIPSGSHILITDTNDIEKVKGLKESSEDEVVGTTTNLSILNTESSTFETTTSAARDEPETETEATTQSSGSTSTESVVTTTTSEDSVDREVPTSTSAPEPVPTQPFQDEENLPLTKTTTPESTTVGSGGESNDEESAARGEAETETEATTQTSGSASTESEVTTTTATVTSEDLLDRDVATSTSAPEPIPTPSFQDEENLPLTKTTIPESTTVGGGEESNDEDKAARDEPETEATTQSSGSQENVVTTTTVTSEDSGDREVATSTSAPEPVPTPTFQDGENLPLTTTTTPESTTSTVGGGGESNDEEVEGITTTTEGFTTTTTATSSSQMLNDDDNDGDPISTTETFSSRSEATTFGPEVEPAPASTTESINQENLSMNDEATTTTGTKTESGETTTENSQEPLESVSKDEAEIEFTTTTMKPETLETTTFDPESKMGQDETEMTMTMTTTTVTPDEVVTTELEKEAEVEVYSDKAVKEPEETVIEIEQMNETTTESVPESTTEIGTTPHGRKIPSGGHILITDTNSIDKVKALKESPEVDVDVEDETQSPEIVFAQEDDEELKTTTPEIVEGEEEATTSSTSTTLTSTDVPLTTTETEAPPPHSTTTISPEIITETGPPVTSRSRTSVVTMSSRVVNKVFVNSSQSRSDTNSRSEFTSTTTELPTSTTDVVGDDDTTTLEYSEFQEEGSGSDDQGQGQNDEINPTTEIVVDYETTSATTSNDTDAVGEDVTTTTTTVAPEIQTVQTTTENFFNDEPTESYRPENVSGESLDFEFDATTTEFVVFEENSTTTTEKAVNETEIEQDDETLKNNSLNNDNKEENDLELVFETSTGESTTEPGHVDFDVTETNDAGFENLTERSAPTAGPGESLVWKLETSTELEQEKTTMTTPTIKDTRTEGENPVKELKIDTAQIERLPAMMTNQTEQVLLDEVTESSGQVTTETLTTTTESAGEEAEVNYDDLVTETELPESVTDIPNREIQTSTNSVESESKSTIRSDYDGESSTISSDSTQKAETFDSAPTTEIAESATESSTTSSPQPGITSSTSTTTEKPEDSEFSDFLNSLSPRRAPALVKSSHTTTTTEAQFKVEVKVGPYNSRALFSSDSTPEEKALQGEISNVVSQLLLTTHKNFHLLPSFVECAGARGRSGRRKTKVLHFDTDNYPWMARIGYREPRGVLFPCAGTIISRRYILTSANCASRKSKYANGESVMEILLEGAKNAAAGVSDQPWYKYKVEEVIVHPEYDNITRENDLALIRLTQEIPPFNGSSEVKPICLPFEDGYGVWDSLPIVGETAYLGGWGYGLKNMAATIDEMEEAAVTIWPMDNCTYLYRGDLNKRITSKHICAYGKAEKDACRGDAGGPLMALMTRQKIFFQIGIVSYGPRCGYGVPAVYTRVNSYLSWILDSMRP